MRYHTLIGLQLKIERLLLILILNFENFQPGLWCFYNSPLNKPEIPKLYNLFISDNSRIWREICILYRNKFIRYNFQYWSKI